MHSFCKIGVIGIIGQLDPGNLYCSDKKVTQSIEVPAPFCVVSGKHLHTVGCALQFSLQEQYSSTVLLVLYYGGSFTSALFYISLSVL